MITLPNNSFSISSLQLHHLPTWISEPELLINRIDFRIILRRQRTLPRLKILLPMRLFPCLLMHNNLLLVDLLEHSASNPVDIASQSVIRNEYVMKIGRQVIETG